MPFLGKNTQKPLLHTPNTQQQGRAAEERAGAYLQAQGLRILQRNYRTPGRGGGEIDLICQAPDGTVVFVEVRSRKYAGFGGAGGSIGSTKKRRIVVAAQHWLLRHNPPPPCRFDVVLLQGADIAWLPAAFDAW